MRSNYFVIIFLILGIDAINELLLDEWIDFRWAAIEFGTTKSCEPLKETKATLSVSAVLFAWRVTGHGRALASGSLSLFPLFLPLCSISIFPFYKPFSSTQQNISESLHIRWIVSSEGYLYISLNLLNLTRERDKESEANALPWHVTLHKYKTVEKERVGSCRSNFSRCFPHMRALRSFLLKCHMCA